MEILIKIPDELYKKLKTPKTVGLSEAFDQRAILVRAIQNGTVLPEGHGRLIDADELKKHDFMLDDDYEPDGYFHGVNLNTIDEMPTIVEADKE